MGKTLSGYRSELVLRRRTPKAGVLDRLLIGVELVTGVAALAGGAALAAAPDGSLLRADPAVLAGTPFTDWRLPGLLLAGLVGGGYVLAGLWQAGERPHARALSFLAGAGLVGFEAAEFVWLGFQPLEAVFALVGLAVATLAGRTVIGQPMSPEHREPPWTAH